jgi:CRISPR-associated exonuclease Cas4
MQLLLVVLLLITAAVFIILASKLKQRAGLPTGKIIYIDTSQWGKIEKPLFDPNLRLVGKPDYLIEQGRKIIPVEVKSRPAPREPHDSHVFQLGAYCLLVEHEFGKRPPYGVLHYVDKSLSIEFTNEFERSVKNAICEMQDSSRKGPLDRSHHDDLRCASCGYRSICDQSLRI